MMNTMEKTKQQVIQKVCNEYQQFVLQCLKEGEWFLFQNSLMITFYKEMMIYIQNAVMCNEWFLQMAEMDHVLDELWKRFYKNVISHTERDFLVQLFDLHLNNIKRLNDRDK